MQMTILCFSVKRLDAVKCLKAVMDRPKGVPVSSPVGLIAITYA